jgi:hypothetical protein
MGSSLVAAQGGGGRPAGLPTDDNAIAFGLRAESALQLQLQDASPMVEVIFQRFAPAQRIEYALEADHYYLGRFRGKQRVIVDLHEYSEVGEDSEASNAPRSSATSVPVNGALSGRQALEAILYVMVPDWKQLCPDRYEYQFVKLVLLGALRCVAYDVRPRHPEDGGFSGRIYLEDRSWNIVRFTGMSSQADALLTPLRAKNSRFRIDSWRINAAKDRWVPALTYIEEVPPMGAPKGTVMKGQVRFWGYYEPVPQQEGESVSSTVSVRGTPRDPNERRQTPPEPSQRAEERRAQLNVVDWMLKARLIGPAGRTEEMLNGILWTLLHDNNLRTGEQVQCRVLLTTRLEAFTVNNIIFVSRGLVDVLPDKPPLALVLAHQLAHNTLGHPKIDTGLAFPEVFWVSDAELLAKLRFQHSVEQENAADRKAMEMIDHSEYTKGMPVTATAMQGLRYYGAKLQNLIQPEFGEHVADIAHNVEFNKWTRVGELFDPERPDQVALLALGSRLIMDPWDGSVEGYQPVIGPERKARERADLAVRPFEPFLDYFVEKPPAQPPHNPSTPAAPGGTRRPGAAGTSPRPAGRNGAP